MNDFFAKKKKERKENQEREKFLQKLEKALYKHIYYILEEKLCIILFL